MSERAHDLETARRRSLPAAPLPAAILAALRPHQWLKNLLVFVPALAAHDFGSGLAAAAVAFLSFSLCASGVYILNDLLDRVHDRAHPTKRFRPFASGALGTAAGLRLAFVLLVAAVLVGLWLPPPFLLILLGYIALTSLYTVSLKQMLIADIVALACLYGARLAAGGAASEIALSPWLAIFSLFIFFCLATVKRCAELADRGTGSEGELAGRAYCADDRPALFAMAAASGFVSVLVLALYVNSEAVRSAYMHPERLWFVCIPLLLWVGRVLILTHRGQMHDDPIVFAATDRASLATAFASAIIVVASV